MKAQPFVKSPSRHFWDDEELVFAVTASGMSREVRRTVRTRGSARVHRIPPNLLTGSCLSFRGAAGRRASFCAVAGVTVDLRDDSAAGASGSVPVVFAEASCEVADAVRWETPGISTRSFGHDPGFADSICGARSIEDGDVLDDHSCHRTASIGEQPSDSFGRCPLKNQGRHRLARLIPPTSCAPTPPRAAPPMPSDWSRRSSDAVREQSLRERSPNAT